MLGTVGEASSDVVVSASVSVIWLSGGSVVLATDSVIGASGSVASVSVVIGASSGSVVSVSVVIGARAARSSR